MWFRTEECIIDPPSKVTFSKGMAQEEQIAIMQRLLQRAYNIVRDLERNIATGKEISSDDYYTMCIQNEELRHKIAMKDILMRQMCNDFNWKCSEYEESISELKKQLGEANG